MATLGTRAAKVGDKDRSMDNLYSIMQSLEVPDMAMEN
jgi:hypothetical protein